MRALRPILALLTVFLALASGSGTVWSADEAPPTEAQISAWVKQLGDEDFGKRTTAKDALIKAGKAAAAALKAAAEGATDLEARNTAAAILGLLKWSDVLADVNYLDALPAESVIAARFTNVDQMLEKGKKTALWGLQGMPEFKPLTDLIAKQIEAGGPDAARTIKWLRAFKGQVAGAVWAFEIMDPTKIRAAAVAELPKDEAEKIFKEFLAETGLDKHMRQDRVDGLPIWAGPQGHDGAVALVGRHLVFAANAPSILQVAQGLTTASAGGLGSAPSFAKVKAALGPSTDFAILMNFPGYMKMLDVMGGGGMGQMMEKMGYDAMEWFALTTSVAGDRFEDRFVVTLNNKPSKLTDLMNQGFASTTPLKDVFAVAPPDAVFAANSYLDGAPSVKNLMEYVKGLFEAQAAMGMPVPNLDEKLQEAEAAVGLKVADVAAAIKGDLAIWGVLGKGLIPPDLGLSIGCPDEAKAKELAGMLAQVVNGISKLEKKNETPAIEKSEKGGHTIYTESEDSPLMEDVKRKAIPYRLSWAACGPRVIVSSSVPALQSRLLAIGAKDPGFDPAKALTGVPGAAETKNLFVLDLRMLLNYGAKFGLPLAAAMVPQPEYQVVLAELSKKEDLFKGLPPLTFTAAPPKDGVSVSSMHSPVPTLASYGIVLFGVFFAVQRPGIAPAPAIGVGGGGF